MSKFYFTYFGNKYKETKPLLKYIDIKKFNKIVEPFSGSSGSTGNKTKHMLVSNI